MQVRQQKRKEQGPFHSTLIERSRMMEMINYLGVASGP